MPLPVLIMISGQVKQHLVDALPSITGSTRVAVKRSMNWYPAPSLVLRPYCPPEHILMEHWRTSIQQKTTTSTLMTLTRANLQTLPPRWVTSPVAAMVPSTLLSSTPLGPGKLREVKMSHPGNPHDDFKWLYPIPQSNHRATYLQLSHLPQWWLE